MFNYNKFKKTVKEWIKKHPNGSVDDIIDFCEELIPSSSYASHKWLIEETAEWYKFVLSNKKAMNRYDDEFMI